MHIEKLKIKNYKCFDGDFEVSLNPGLNIIVGDNEVGKSTILEAINIALTGMLSGRPLRYELSPYLFNKKVQDEYLKSIVSGKPKEPPEIVIELYLTGDDVALAELLGDGNSDKNAKAMGVVFKVAFDPGYQSEYEALVSGKNVNTIPIEYYRPHWQTFARKETTSRGIPLKAALIDASQSKANTGSDVFVSRIIKDGLDGKERVAISQAHRMLRDNFRDHESIKAINDKIKSAAKISNKEVAISVDLASQNAWEQSLVTFIDSVPFHLIGKGEQCIIKTKLALSHRRAAEATVLLIEEPENHLSHTRLNGLLAEIESGNGDKQIIVTTHSSFVANKLGLGNLILLRGGKTTRLGDLKSRDFFKRLAGYDTLRVVLADRCILVEGDSDELIVQRAYMDMNAGKLPIEDGIDVISVGTAFLRFLEIAHALKVPVCVVTDNDGDVEALKKKYKEYDGVEGIRICYDSVVDGGDLVVGGKAYNYNTLEPKLLKANDRDTLNKVFSTNFATDDELRTYMKGKKTECALAVFESPDAILMPQYIYDALEP